MKTTTFLKFVAATLILCMNAAYSMPVFPHNGGNSTQKSNTDSAYCLKLNGKMSKTGKITESFTVALLHNNTPVDSMVVKNGNSFKFVLKKDTWYSVRISKPGAVSKLISICTLLPRNATNYFFQLDFTVDELISEEEAEFLDKETLDFPMAIFVYDYKLKRFNYLEEYTSNIRKHLAAPVVGANTAGLSTARILPRN
ncbi:MAG: hypothetical protein ACXVP0_08245 [Bacteroidia bacterium]